MSFFLEDAVIFCILAVWHSKLIGIPAVSPGIAVDRPLWSFAYKCYSYLPWPLKVPFLCVRSLTSVWSSC